MQDSERPLVLKRNMKSEFLKFEREIDCFQNLPNIKKKIEKGTGYSK